MIDEALELADIAKFIQQTIFAPQLLKMDHLELLKYLNRTLAEKNH